MILTVENFKILLKFDPESVSAENSDSGGRMGRIRTVLWERDIRPRQADWQSKAFSNLNSTLCTGRLARVQKCTLIRNRSCASIRIRLECSILNSHRSLPSYDFAAKFRKSAKFYERPVPDRINCCVFNQTRQNLKLDKQTRTTWCLRYIWNKSKSDTSLSCHLNPAFRIPEYLNI